MCNKGNRVSRDEEEEEEVEEEEEEEERESARVAKNDEKAPALGFEHGA